MDAPNQMYDNIFRFHVSRRIIHNERSMFFVPNNGMAVHIKGSAPYHVFVLGVCCLHKGFGFIKKEIEWDT